MKASDIRTGMEYAYPGWSIEFLDRVNNRTVVVFSRQIVGEWEAFAAQRNAERDEQDRLYAATRAEEARQERAVEALTEMLPSYSGFRTKMTISATELLALIETTKGA